MKIVLWIGNEPNQIALANKIHENFPVDTIFVETKKIKQKLTVLFLFKKIIEKLFLSDISDAWFNMLFYYKKKYPNLPRVNIIHTDNINNDDVYQKSKLLTPDLIIVSGTRLIKEKLLSLNPKIGIVNLHTGVSPYIKGGPNCTNWCIANSQFHLIGNTIMWIDKGIDSGNIITTELTSFNGEEDLCEVHLKVMEHAHGLYIKAISYLAHGKIGNVPQSEITEGKIFYTKEWTLGVKFRLIKNFKNFKSILNSKEYKQKQQELRIIKIQ